MRGDAHVQRKAHWEEGGRRPESRTAACGHWPKKLPVKATGKKRPERFDEDRGFIRLSWNWGAESF